MSLSTVLSLAVTFTALGAPLTDSLPRSLPDGGGVAVPPRHELSSPAVAGMSSTALVRAEESVQEEIRRGAFPGAALAVGRWSHVVIERGMGRTGSFPGDPAVDPDLTVYDLASLTKVVGTTSAVMLLVEDGRMGLDDPVSAYLPEYVGGGRERVTIRHLLTHTSGLPDWANLTGPTERDVLAAAVRVPLQNAPGMRVRYTDVGFVILWAAAERAAGEPLYRLLDRRLFAPLAMHSTTFNMGEGCRRCAGTARAQGAAFQGRVHDPISRRMGGITGNAGLFSTVHDVARFAAMMANGGVLDGVRVFREQTVREFTRRQPGTGTRALGWDTPGEPGSGPAGSRVSSRSFGHTGFTGTSIWIDPDRGTWVVLLANRTYVDGPNRMQALRRTLHDRVSDAADTGPRVATARE
jgi:CubicO group peptidase (beta-lactamase class C family)